MLKFLYCFCNNEIPLLMELSNNSPNKCNRFRVENNTLQQWSLKEANWINCEVIFRKIHLDEKFYKYVMSTIAISHAKVPSIKTSDPYESQIYGIKIDGKIESVVSGLINKALNQNDEFDNFGIFDFIASLLFRIVKAHAFHNGNKKTAILSISYLLDSFGYYIV